MDVFDLFAKITLDSEDYERQLGEAGSKTSGFADKLKSGLAAAGKVAGAGLAAATTAIAALGTDPAPMKAIYAQRRAYVTSRLKAMGLSFPEPEGAFYVFVDITKYGLDSSTFCTRMIREGKVAAVPGNCFGAEGYIRLSYCYSEAELQKGLDRLEAFIQTL